MLISAIPSRAVAFGLLLLVGLQAAEKNRSDKNPSPGYLLGSGDELSIKILDLDEIPDRPFRIDDRGLIHLPLLGDISAAGLTTSQVESQLRERARRILLHPSVTVNLVAPREQTVTVLGAVNSPGEKPIHGSKNLLDALSLAGGLKPDAGSTIRLTRPVENGPIQSSTAHLDSSGRFWTSTVYIAPALRGENPGENIPLRAHDVVTVPRADTVFVIGEVLRPGGYEIGESLEIAVLDALARAGGTNGSANSAKARVLRSVPGRAERKEIVFDLNRILAGKEPDMALQANDILYIPTHKAKLLTARAIETIVGTGSSIAVFRGSR